MRGLIAAVLSGWIAASPSFAAIAAPPAATVGRLTPLRAPLADATFSGPLGLPAPAAAAIAPIGVPALPPAAAPTSAAFPFAPNAPAEPAALAAAMAAPIAAALPAFGARPIALADGPTEVDRRAQDYFKSGVDRMARLVPALASWYADQEAGARSRMVELFGDQGDIEARAKSEKSIYRKLRLKHFERLAKEGRGIKHLSEALGAITDGVGVRVIARDASSLGMKRFVKKIVEHIDGGRLVITELINYSVEGHPYLRDEDIALIREAVERNGGNLLVSPAPDHHGYSSLHLVGTIDGIPVEIQVRGKMVNVLAEAEHFIYDADHGKPLGRLDSNLRRTISTLHKLTRAQRAAYHRYLADCYRDARFREIGHTPPSAPAPKLPASLEHLPELSLKFIAAARSLPLLN